MCQTVSRFTVEPITLPYRQTGASMMQYLFYLLVLVSFIHFGSEAHTCLHRRPFSSGFARKFVAEK